MVERDANDDGDDIDTWIKEKEQTEIMNSIKKLDRVPLETTPVHLSPFFKIQKYIFWATDIE
jgi:hypothetical protein